MSEEIALAAADLATVEQLRTQIKALSLQLGELNTTIGYQDAKLRRAEADAGWLRGLVVRAIAHLDSFGEIGTPRAAMAEDLEVLLTKTGDAGAAFLAELEAARAEHDLMKALLIKMRHYIINHGLLIGECVAWMQLKTRYGIGESQEADAEWLRAYQTRVNVDALPLVPPKEREHA